MFTAVVFIAGVVAGILISYAVESYKDEPNSLCLECLIADAEARASLGDSI